MKKGDVRKQKNKINMIKTITILSFILLFITSTIYILNYSETEPKIIPSKKIKHIQKEGTIFQITGWSESNWNDTDDSPWIVNDSVNIYINYTNITFLKFEIKVFDSDSNHTESDQGSNPDNIRISVRGGNISTDESQGITPAAFYIEIGQQISSPNGSYLSPNWSIQIHADCYGGKYHDPFLPPYKDQGVNYTISADYVYLDGVIIKGQVNQNETQLRILPLIMLIIILSILFVLLTLTRLSKNRSNVTSEIVSCPICHHSFNIKKTGKPIRVNCPKCSFQIKFKH